jgi:hypothetical protein
MPSFAENMNAISWSFSKRNNTACIFREFGKLIYPVDDQAADS